MILRLISNLLLAYNRFSRRVSQAFSFNKTPRKLTRAISGMAHGLNPFGRDPRQFDKGGVCKLFLISIAILNVSTVSVPLKNISGNLGTGHLQV